MTTDLWKVGASVVFELDRSPVLGRLMVVMRRTDGRSVPGFRDGACPLATLAEGCSEEEAQQLVDQLNRLGDTLAIGRLCPDGCVIAPDAPGATRSGDPAARRR